MLATTNYTETIHRLGPDFAARAAQYDAEDRFVTENWAALKGEKFFSAMVPTELGGGGLPHSAMCRLIFEMARYCSSTALAFSMHQHLVAAAIWNFRHGNPAEKLLRRVAESEAVLVSTGANDWLSSSGTLTPCDGGFRVTASKAFSSGSPGGDLILTSSRYDDPEKGMQVVHFPVPMRADGVRIENNWKAMGMRGTGSHTLTLENVFVPQDSVGLRRAAGQFHNMWNIVLTVALPLVAGAYLGTASAAARIACEGACKKHKDDLTAVLIGEMENDLTTAELAFESMVAIANDLSFEPSVEKTDQILIRKTIVTQSAIRTAEKALELAGGGGYFRASGLERMLRDVHAGPFHPLPPKRQQRFTGRLKLGLDVDES